MNISQEKLYVLSNDEKNNVYLAMMAKVGLPDEKAKIQYNGTEHALLLRDNENMIVLDFIPEQLHPVMKKAKSVNIVETLSDFETVIRRYEVPIHQSQTPYPKNILDCIEKPENSKE